MSEATGTAGSSAAPPAGHRRLAALGATAAEVVLVLVAVAALFARPVPALLTLLAVAVASAGLVAFAVNRGILRLIGAGLVVIGLAGAAVLVIAGELLLVLIVLFLLGAIAAGLATLALRPRPYRPPERRAAPPSAPFLLMNPWSGGGKIRDLGLDELARSMGAEVVLLERGMDVPATLERAVADGADLLGAAGGDGTQGLVAQAAAEHDLPVLVIPAGTRNHFALDLGLDRDDPRAAVEALGEGGVEIRVDLGRIADRTFVNNASLGVYARIISSPEYRGAKLTTALEALPHAAAPDSESGLRVRGPDGTIHEDPELIQVGNNQYEYRDLRTQGTRPRLDAGRLGIELIDYSSHDELRRVVAALLSGQTAAAKADGLLARWTAPSLTVESAGGTVAAGVDGEYLELRSPLEISSRPGALRVRVPGDRPGLPAPLPTSSIATLRTLWSLARGSAG